MSARISSLVGQKQLPATIDWDGMVCAVVESAAEVRFFDPRRAEERVEFEDFSSGIAFGPVAEVRWQKRRNGLHVVYLHEGGQELPGCSSRAELVPMESKTVFLWGRRSGDSRELYEDRIPRVFLLPGDDGSADNTLRYPVGVLAPGDQQRLRLRVQWYRKQGKHPVMTAAGVEWKAAEERLYRWVSIESGEDDDA